MFTLAELEAAHALVLETLQPTPALRWPLLCERLGADAIVKHENHNPTGAFKVRGGLTYVDALMRRAPGTRALVSATRGNHGQSLAFACGRAGLAPIIYVPHGNSVEKNAAMRALRRAAGRARRAISRPRARRPSARRAARPELVPSFHRDLVRGVATYSLELLRAHPDLDVHVCPDRPGLGHLRRHGRARRAGLATEIVGVQAEGAPAYALSFAAGRAVDHALRRHLADGMATRAPDAEALDSSCAASRASCGQRRRDRRSDPRLLDGYAQSRGRGGRGAARRGLPGEIEA